jgi:class 3 adenylate cyclase
MDCRESLTRRTLVSSVIFLDIVGYSTMGVGRQVELKQAFNEALRGALRQLDASERVVVDTGDGAAITVLTDPERALFLAIAIFDNIGDIRVRGGVNLGPISLAKDINGQPNVIGDGINVAQRIMDFAEEGELLVSRSFQETVGLMSPDYASMFSHVGERTDKHGRSHDVYSVLQGVRVARRMAERQARAITKASPPPPPGQVTVSDAGPHLLVSAPTEAVLREALKEFVAKGRRITSQPVQSANKWFASVDKPEAEGATVAAFGNKRMITGPTRESVELKLAELREFGAVLLHEIECIDGVWTAVCEKG